MSYILGFDGGGTKTECVVMNPAGAVISRAVGGPSNSSRIGVEAAVRNVVAAAEEALSKANLGRADANAIGAALAGTTDPDRRERVHTRLEADFPNSRIRIMTDLDAALAAAPQGPTIVLVAGTGSVAIGRNSRGEIVRAGGYGRFSSDEGSAFDVGMKAIAAAQAERGRRGSESRMGADILKALGCTSWDQVQDRAQKSPDDVYPMIFPVIAADADAADELARKVLRGAAEKLCLLAVEAATQLGLPSTEFALVKIGGMLGRSKFFDAELANELSLHLPSALEGQLRMSPAEAAALAARDAYV